LFFPFWSLFSPFYLVTAAQISAEKEDQKRRRESVDVDGAVFSTLFFFTLNNNLKE